jgi:hypothetical protein
MSILTWGWRKILLRALAVIFIIYVALVIYRAFHFWNLEKTNKQVEKIHSTKLTLDDVFGRNLPPDPGAEADKTVQGVDANTNGIRDDVELAIFKEYPNSTKTRAALLQYALALQMGATQSMVNTIIVDKVIGEQSRAGFCVADSLVPRKTPESDRSNTDVEKIDTFIDFIEDRQFNTDAREKARKDFYKNIGNFANSVKDEECDIDYLQLSN